MPKFKGFFFFKKINFCVVKKRILENNLTLAFSKPYYLKKYNYLVERSQPCPTIKICGVQNNVHINHLVKKPTISSIFMLYLGTIW